MSGALASFARVRRRRFEAGGSAYTQGYDKSPPPEDDANTSDNSADPAGPSGGDAPMSTYSSGALAAGAPMTTDQTLDAHQTAANNLMQRLPDATTQIMNGAGIHTPSYLDMTGLDPAQREGATNLPMLAAAGAMLQPTHSGTFSEALGRAFSAAAPVAEKDREIYENAMLRKAQQDNTAAYQQGMLGVRNRQASTAEQRAATYAALAAARAQHMRDGDDEKTANDKSMMDWRNGKLDAWIENAIATNNIAQQRANTGDRRADSADQAVQARILQNRNTEDWRNAQLILRARIADVTSQNAILSRAENLAAQSGMTVSDAMKQILESVPASQTAREPIQAPQVGGGSGGSATPAAKQPAHPQADIDATVAAAKAKIASVKGTADEKAVTEAVKSKMTANGYPTDGL